MIGLRFSLPEVNWHSVSRKNVIHSHPVPPPSTCYGCLLAMVGEWDIRTHYGSRVTGGVKRFAVEKIKARSKDHVRKEQVLVNVDAFVWLDSSDEEGMITLEDRLLGLLGPGPLLHEQLPAGKSLGRKQNKIQCVSLLGDNFVDTHFSFLKKNMNNPDRMPLKMGQWENSPERVGAWAYGLVTQVSGFPDSSLLHTIT